MIRFLLISSLFWAMTLLIYRFGLKKFTFHHLNRGYLLLTLVGGTLLPFLPISNTVDAPFVVFLEPIVIQLNGVANETVIAPVMQQSINYEFLLWTIYGMIVLWMVGKFIHNVIQLRQKARRGKVIVQEGIQVVYSSEIEQPFSFWKWVFINDKKELDPIILVHEYAHVKGNHSWDKIIIQLLEAIYWMIPVFGLYRRYINEVHEYIADEYVLHHTSKKKYSYFLLGQTNLQTDLTAIPVLSNNFHSLIKNRIIMILRKKSKKHSQLWYLPVLLLVFSLGTIVLVSCEATEDLHEQVSIEDIQSLNSAELEKMIDKGILDAGNKKSLFGNTLEIIDTITTFDATTYEESVEIVKNEVDIYRVVEEMPRFPTKECENLASQAEKKKCADLKLLNYIYGNIEYPSNAKKEGREGQVVFQFVVDPDGNLLRPEILRSIGDDFDEAVLTMFSKLQKHTWTPGKQKGKTVAVSFILPIKFKLAD